MGSVKPKHSAFAEDLEDTLSPEAMPKTKGESIMIHLRLKKAKKQHEPSAVREDEYSKRGKMSKQTQGSTKGRRGGRGRKC